jgi:hypothetical protein
MIHETAGARNTKPGGAQRLPLQPVFGLPLAMILALSRTARKRKFGKDLDPIPSYRL